MKTVKTFNNKSEVLNFRKNFRTELNARGMDNYFKVLGTGREVHTSIEVSRKHITDTWGVIDDLGYPITCEISYYE